MRRGDFSELLNPNNGFFTGARSIIDPLTGQPFPGNVIPPNRLSPNGLAILNAVSAADAGLPAGHGQPDQYQPEPAGSAQGQHPPRLPAEHRATSSPIRYSRYSWTAVDAFRGDLPVRAHRLVDRPNFTQTASWTSTLTQQPDQRARPTRSRATTCSSTCSPETGLYQRSRNGINYPYIFPEKEIDDKIPTVTITGFQTHRRRPVSGVLVGPDPHLSQHRRRWCGAATRFKAGVRSSTRARTTSTRSTSAPFRAAPTTRTAASSSSTARAGGTGLAMANVALGLFSNYAELGQRNFTAVARRWRPTCSSRTPGSRPATLTIEGGVPLRLLAALVLDDQQHRQLRSALLRRGASGGHQPGDRPAGQRSALQRRRAAGRRLRGRRRRLGARAAIRRCWRCSAASRAASRETHANAFEPRLGVQLLARTTRRSSAPAAASSTTASR